MRYSVLCFHIKAEFINLCSRNSYLYIDKACIDFSRREEQILSGPPRSHEWVKSEI
jgi:hypothetical protein